MAYTFEQLQQLPELQGLVSLDQLPNYQDALSNYRTLNLGENTGGIYDALARNSYDFGDQRLIKSDVADYYDRLSTTLQGMGGSGITGYGFADPIANTASISAPRTWAPYANFSYGTPDSDPNLRYVPYELISELNTDAQSGNVQAIRELLANPEFLSNASLAMLPDSSGLGTTDWMGTDYKFDNPNLGFVFDKSLADRLMAAGADPSWEGSAASTSPVTILGNDGQHLSPFGESPLGNLRWMENQGTTAAFSGVPIHKMTPEMQAAILGKIQAYDTGLENMTYARNGLTEDWWTPYRDAEWLAVDPNNSANIMVGQTGANGIDWRQLGPSLTDAGVQHLQGTMEAARQSYADSNFMESLMQMMPTAMAGFALGPVLGGSGFFGDSIASLFGDAGAGALASTSEVPLGSLGSGLTGVDLAGAGIYGQTPLMLGELGSGLAGTTASSLGLDAAMLGATGAGALGAELPSFPSGSTQTFSDALSTATNQLGSGINDLPVINTQTGTLGANIQPATTMDGFYNPVTFEDLAGGALEGASGTFNPATSSVSDIVNAVSATGGEAVPTGIGALPEYLEGAVAAGGEPTFWDRVTNALKSYGSSPTSGATKLLTELGIPENIAGGLLGGLQMWSAIQGRGDQAAANAAAHQNTFSAPFRSGLSPTAWAGPGRGAPLSQTMMTPQAIPQQQVTPRWNQPIQRAAGGLTAMRGANNSGPAMGYIAGGTAGQDDKIPALLSDGEYVLDADIVSALGDGNNEAGAAALDQMRENIRRHKRSAPVNKIPPKAKKPEQYMKGARK